MKLSKTMTPSLQLEMAIELLESCNNDLSTNYTDSFFTNRSYLEKYSITEDDKRGVFLMAYSLLSNK